MKDGDLLVAYWQKQQSMLSTGRQVIASTKLFYDADYWLEFVCQYFSGGKN